MEEFDMYAIARPHQNGVETQPADQSAVPYCFVLDDSYRVVMAGPAGSEEPFAELYDAESSVDSLPGPIDRVVRVLTASWRSEPNSVTPASASVNNLKVTVAPLHGFAGRRIAVFVGRNTTGA
jgi:hypothetical protein